MFSYDYNIARAIANQRVEETLREAEEFRLIEVFQGSRSSNKRQRLAIPRFMNLLLARIVPKADTNLSSSRSGRQEEYTGNLESCPGC